MKKLKKIFAIILCLLFVPTTSVVLANENEIAAVNTTKFVYLEKHSSYDDVAEKKKESILNSNSIVKPTENSYNTTFYISADGDDSNDGKSINTPWKTTDNLWNYSWFKYGDVVLFERGGVYRNAHFVAMNGISYGAYGEGEKPILYGSAMNFAKSEFWNQTENENIWKIQLNEEITNIGNIVFDFDKYYANYKREFELEQNFDFWEDKQNNVIYLYYSLGNPGECFSDIEICDGRNIISAGPNSNIKIDNLCLRYTGAHGMSFGDGGKNVTITNCEVGFIGGSELVGFPNFVRYGNGIEFYGNSDNSLVENCYVYECYDAGLTCQGNNSVISNLTFKRNLVEYCQYNIEVWVGDEALKYSGYSENDNSKLINCVFENNILRFAGYNFQFDNRLGSNTSAAACISAYDFCLPCDENTVIRNNVFDTSYRYLISIVQPNSKNGPKISDNIYITNAFSTNEQDVLGNIPSVACVGQTRINNDRNTYYANDFDTMSKSVAVFDLNPMSVLYDSDKYMNCHVVSDWIVKKNATCVSVGEKIKCCIYCQKVFETQEITPTGHKTVTKNSKKSNYFSYGYTGDKVCSKCGKVFSKGKNVAKLKLKTPVIRLSSKKKTVKVSYKKIKDAHKYEISIKIGGKWKKYNTSKLTYTIKNKSLKVGKTYYVKVRAYRVYKNKKAYSSYSKSVKIKVKK